MTKRCVLGFIFTSEWHFFFFHRDIYVPKHIILLNSNQITYLKWYLDNNKNNEMQFCYILWTINRSLDKYKMYGRVLSFMAAHRGRPCLVGIEKNIQILIVCTYIETKRSKTKIYYCKEFAQHNVVRCELNSSISGIIQLSKLNVFAY